MDPILQQLLDEYKRSGPESYDWLGDYQYQQIDPALLESLGDTELAGIQTDPRYDQYIMSALADLEDQARTGFTARDEADLARIEAQNRRQLKGSEGAIRQNMAARGIGGSGLEFIARQQAAQDAADRQALAGLEKLAQMGERRQSATARLGGLGSQLQGQQYDQLARAASAQDAINRFNTANRVGAQMENIRGVNQAGMFNQQGRQSQANLASGAKQAHRDKTLDLGYNARVEDLNRQALIDAERRRRRSGVGAAIGGALGAGVGGFFGGPAGAGAGYGVGSGLGGAFAAHGGEVTDDTGIDAYENDTKMVFVSPGEVIVPRSKADNPQEAAMFVEQVTSGSGGSVEDRNDPDEDDVVEALLGVVDALSKRRRRA